MACNHQNVRPCDYSFHSYVTVSFSTCNTDFYRWHFFPLEVFCLLMSMVSHSVLLIQHSIIIHPNVYYYKTFFDEYTPATGINYHHRHRYYQINTQNVRMERFVVRKNASETTIYALCSHDINNPSLVLLIEHWFYDFLDGRMHFTNDFTWTWSIIMDIDVFCETLH